MSELRSLPSVDRVAEALDASLPHPLRVTAARAAVGRARTAVMNGDPAPSFEDVVSFARTLLHERQEQRLQPVLNATGVLIHTNLGRVPLGPEQLAAVARVAGAYSNLEYDLGAGTRGDRYQHARELICAVTKAESALVVNNNAAAVLLTLAALCKDREVIISRGELIEIGGEFRIPEVMAASGARLVEVGTTNRTHPRDYERAVGDMTGAILKVHPSNYQVVGFTATVPPREIAEVARRHNVPFIHDLGSGLIARADRPEWMQHDPPIDLALEDGADLVTFSGDKLLGGPQAGVIAGRNELIERIARHPLLRALRVDKMTLAALEATLDLYAHDRAAELPFWAMALTPLDALEARAKDLAGSWSEVDDAVKIEALLTSAVPGGGSAPGRDIPSWGIAIEHPELTADELNAVLRKGTPPVIGRIENDRVVLDLRTVPADHDVLLSTVVTGALRP